MRLAIEPQVSLIDYDDDPLAKVATAARLCYSSKGAEELKAEMTAEEQQKLVRKILKLGHYSTLEHAYFTFHVVCSRVTSHQLT